MLFIDLSERLASPDAVNFILLGKEIGFNITQALNASECALAIAVNKSRRVACAAFDQSVIYERNLEIGFNSQCKATLVYSKA